MSIVNVSEEETRSESHMNDCASHTSLIAYRNFDLKTTFLLVTSISIMYYPIYIGYQSDECVNINSKRR